MLSLGDRVPKPVICTCKGALTTDWKLTLLVADLLPVPGLRFGASALGERTFSAPGSGVIPSPFTTQAYRDVFGNPQFRSDLAVTIIVTIVSTAIVLAIITLRRGLSARYDKHRRIARWTLPIWLYVSVTGVVVYVMLYHVA